MPTLVIRDLMNQWKTQVATAKHPDAGNLFVKVYEDGEAPDRTKLPICELAFGDQEVTESTGKIRTILPVIAKVIFDDKSGASDNDGKRNVVQDDIFRALYKIIMETDTTRTIGGKAFSTQFAGGGTKVTPEDVDEASSRFSITLEFESFTGHLVGDPDTRT